MVEGEGFEPPKAEPADLQSAPVDRLGTPPKGRDCVAYLHALSISHGKVRALDPASPGLIRQIIPA